MKKKYIWLLVIVILALCIILPGAFDDTLSARDLSIDDFVWKTEPSTHYGVVCYSFSLTNRSDYDVIAVEVTYKVRDDVSESALKVYDDFMELHEGYIKKDDSPKDIVLRGHRDVLVPKGGKLTDLRFTVGFRDLTWSGYPTEAQFKLMEPYCIQMGVIGNDNNLYRVYYYFTDNTWLIGHDTKPVNTWSTKEIAQKISKPPEGYYFVEKDKEDYFEAYVFGVTEEKYAQYLESIKKAGFTEEDDPSDYTTYFVGTNAEGYEVTLAYDSNDCRLHIFIDKET